MVNDHQRPGCVRSVKMTGDKPDRIISRDEYGQVVTITEIFKVRGKTKVRLHNVRGNATHESSNDKSREMPHE